MPRFFLSMDHIPGGSIELTGQQASHARVLRLRPGDAVTVCDGAGTDYDCSLAELTADRLVLTVCGQAPSASEPRLHTTVYMAFAKSDKLEHVIQKATELGACEIVAFPSARCVSRPDDRSLGKKLDRWQKIAASAAEQSGRGRIPTVRTVSSFREALAEAAGCDFSALLYENERATTFRSRIGDGSFATAAILTGPEGGFEPSEVEEAAAAGLSICTLGPRILRCETAPLCALTALLFVCGELD